MTVLTGKSDFGTVAYGSEGGLFQRWGVPAVICGPGSMNQGHKPDEYVTSEQLALCDAMLKRLVDHARTTLS
jgi:acetylornithine deacetylase